MQNPPGSARAPPAPGFILQLMNLREGFRQKTLLQRLRWQLLEGVERRYSKPSSIITASKVSLHKHSSVPSRHPPHSILRPKSRPDGRIRGARRRGSGCCCPLPGWDQGPGGAAGAAPGLKAGAAGREEAKHNRRATAFFFNNFKKYIAYGKKKKQTQAPSQSSESVS